MNLQQLIKLPIATLLMLCVSFSCETEEPPVIEPGPASIPKSYHYKTPGESAKDLLSSNTFATLEVEIHHLPGSAPTAAALNNLETLISSRLNKPGGVYVISQEVTSAINSTYSIDNIRAIEDSNRTSYARNDTLSIYFVFVDNAYSENQGNSKVLGIAYRNTSMVLFQKTIQDLSGGLGQPGRTQLESTVINHELGHILGLVNNGSAMQVDHQDTSNGSHCDNADCLMFWEAETGNVVSNLIGTAAIPAFDQNCVDDLRANGGK